MDRRISQRSGRLVRQAGSVHSFVPKPLPPDPPVQFDAELISLLSRAGQALGRLDGITENLPSADLFVAMFVRREAVDSSAIEGTQSTLQDILAFELQGRDHALPTDVEEVFNYVRAMNVGLRELSRLPLSLRLIKIMHRELLQDTRGATAAPGEFRVSQNWIGASGAGIEHASFVPPPPQELDACLADLEKFFHTSQDIPDLIVCALCHGQFETIHPFLDGNGRVGQLLITFLLVYRDVLRKPTLYLSTFFKQRRQEYYDRLTAIRFQGDWEGWIRFFLRGVVATADEAYVLAQRIIQMREHHRSQLQHTGATANSLRLLDHLFEQPLVNARNVANHLEISDVTANNALRALQSHGLVSEITGRERGRFYRYEPYWALFTARPQPFLSSHDDPNEMTQS